jgi:hypothetical protein
LLRDFERHAFVPKSSTGLVWINTFAIYEKLKAGGET